MSDKHFKDKYKLFDTTVDMTNISELDAQIAKLKEQKREVGRNESRANLAKVVGNKNSTAEQVLDACYSYIGFNRLNTARRSKKEPQVAPSE